MLLSAYAMVVALAGPFMTMFASGFNRKYLMTLTMVIFLISYHHRLHRHFGY
ncbi:hypothetical protein [Pedobacter sp. NJ-S-72]